MRLVVITREAHPYLGGHTMQYAVRRLYYQHGAPVRWRIRPRRRFRQPIGAPGLTLH